MVNNTTTSTISPVVCDTYTSPSGKVWTATNTYMDTIPNSVNCDSIITINLLVNSSSTGTISPVVCDSYISPSGKVWTATNTYLDTIPNSVNCDSIITINLTVNSSTFDTLNPVVCYSYTSPSGKVWTASNTYMDTIPNAIGCDSIFTINLTVNPATTSTITPEACDTYTSPSGKVWTASNTYMDTIPNVAGCDSIITIDLTINTNTATISKVNEVLTASNADTYQWINCADSSNIAGETNQVFTATTSGNFTVETVLNGCVDTASCVGVIIANITDLENNAIQFYPNPTKGNVTFDLGNTFAMVQVEVMDVTGKVVSTQSAENTDQLQVELKGHRGVYLIRLVIDDVPTSVVRVIKD